MFKYCEEPNAAVMTHTPPYSRDDKYLQPVPATVLSQNRPSHNRSTVSVPDRYVPRQRTAVDTDVVSKSLSDRIDELSAGTE